MWRMPVDGANTIHKTGEKNMKSTSLLLAACTTLALLIISRPAISMAEKMTVLKAAGCKTEYFLLHDLSDAYRMKTGNKIQVGRTGNKKAVNLLMDNKIDFAFTCKTIDQLADKLHLDKQAISGWKSIPVAIDPIVIVANPQNGVTGITTAQLTQIFQGKIKNWKEVGGKDLPVLPSFMNPNLESGVVLLFKEFTVGDGKLDENAQITEGPSMSGNYVSVTPGAVTFMGYTSYREKYGKILRVGGIAPTRENILAGKYILSATYYLTVAGNENEDVSKFVDYALSEAGMKAIGSNFIPYSE